MNHANATRPDATRPDEAAFWSLPETPPVIEPGPGRSGDDIARRADLVDRIASIAEQQQWSKSEAARRIDIKEPTFNQWISGKYPGRLAELNSKVSNFLDQLDETSKMEEALPVSPPFIKTRISEEITHMLLLAQTSPGMVMICAEAGMGKTATARQYVAKHGNCWLVTISPHTSKMHGMLLAVAETVLNGAAINNSNIVAAIGKRVQRRDAPTLLIIDEAQNLSDEATNQLRHFTDNFQCGIAMLGNSESYSRFSSWGAGTRFAQLRRRIMKRLQRTSPRKEDLVAYIRAWGIADKAMSDFLVGVGMKPGAMGQIEMTVKLAKIHALGERRELTLPDLKAAWSNRDVEV